MRYLLPAILLFALAVPNGNGQIVTVNSGFSADSVMIGKHVTYSITVESGNDMAIAFPEYSDTITGEIEILRAFPADTTFDGAKRRITREYLVTSFEPGWNTVPPQPVAFKSPDLSDTLFTKAMLLTVLAPAVDTTQAIMPIKPPVNTPVSFAEIFPWLLAGLGAAALVFLVIYLFKRYRRKKDDPEFYSRKPLEPAHVIAFRELELLKNEKLPQTGRVKEYYSRLTEIVRVYITRQFHIHAMESTTTEILHAFSQQPDTDKKLRDLLENLLMLADLVKFAKEDPLMEENEKHLANAYYFVDNTYKLFYSEEKDEDAENSADDSGTSIPAGKEVTHG